MSETWFIDLLEGLHLTLLDQPTTGLDASLQEVISLLEDHMPEAEALTTTQWVALFRKPVREWWPGTIPLVLDWDHGWNVVSRQESTLTAEALETLHRYRPGVIADSLHGWTACFEVPNDIL